MTKREVLKYIAEYGSCEKLRCVDCPYYEQTKHCLGSVGLLNRIGAMAILRMFPEKENAILKKQQFSLTNERNTFLAQNEQYEKDLIDFNENLTEAKEIMIEWKNKVCKELNEGCPGCDYCHYGEIKIKTENFLKE